MSKGQVKQKRQIKQQKKLEKQTNKGESYFDYSLLAVLVLLICFGLIMLYSTSSYSAMLTYGDSMFYLKRQLQFTVLGFVGLIIVVKVIPVQLYYKLATLIYVGALFLMILVQTPLGKEVNGARRWIRLPAGQQIQPAEITKIAVILFIPVVICKMGKHYKETKARWIVLLLGFVAFLGALIFTENLSTGLIIMGISAVVLFVSHPKMKSLVIAAVSLVGVGAVALLYISTRISTSTDFRMRRLLVWLSPEEHAAEGGYQVMQGLYAIGSGGLFGKGLGQSAQKMVIPEVQNDMILTVICEELGIFGAVMMFLLFGFLLYRLLFIAQNAPNLYSSLVVVGIFAHIALQVILNVAVVTGILPTTGITLPFISYGGTSTLFLLAEMGIALSISKTIRLQ